MRPRGQAPRPPAPRAPVRSEKPGRGAPSHHTVGKPRKTFLKSQAEVRGGRLLWWLRHIPVRGTTHLGSQEQGTEAETCPEVAPEGTADTRRSPPRLNEGERPLLGRQT